MQLRVREDEQPKVSARPFWLPIDVPLGRARRDAGTARKQERRPTMASVMQRLPQADDTREALVGAAHRAMDRTRGAMSSALEQMPELSLPSFPDALQSMPSLPDPRRRKRNRRPWMLILGAVAAVAAGGFLAYRWMTRTTPEDYGIDDEWPAEPNPGNKKQEPEDDRQASLDAEESLDARMGATPAAAAAGRDVNGSH